MAAKSPTGRSLDALRALGYAPWVEIPLTKGLVAKVDLDDLEMLSSGGKWVASGSGCRFYAVRGSRRRELMHRLITGARAGEYVDHISGDTLDNRRGNLRICTKQQNHFNSRKRNPRSGYKGVAQHHDGVRWVARLTIDGRNLYLGTFSDPADAAKAYDAAAKLHHGEFARGNFL